MGVESALYQFFYFLRVEVGNWLICTAIQFKLKPCLSVFAITVPYSERFVVTLYC